MQVWERKIYKNINTSRKTDLSRYLHICSLSCLKVYEVDGRNMTKVKIRQKKHWKTYGSILSLNCVIWQAWLSKNATREGLAKSAEPSHFISEVFALQKWSCSKPPSLSEVARQGRDGRSLFRSEVCAIAQVKLSLPLNFAIRRNFTHGVNFTIDNNFTCPWANLVLAFFPIRIVR